MWPVVDIWPAAANLHIQSHCRRLCNRIKESWRCEASLFKRPFATSALVSKHWRCMVGCGKGPHYLREGVRMETIQATFLNLCSRVTSPGDAWPLVAKPPLYHTVAICGIEIFQVTVRVLCHRVKALAMAGHGKSPHYVRKGVTIEILQAAFFTFRLHPQALVMQGGQWQRPQSCSRRRRG